MNIRGIQLLRKLGYEGPRKEIFFRDMREVNLDYLYQGAKIGATIIVFDIKEDINQNPLWEKNVRQYKVQRGEFAKVLDNLVMQMQSQGVKYEDMVFYAHQSYREGDIAFAGRAGIHLDELGFGEIVMDVKGDLREPGEQYLPDYAYICPVYGNRPFRSQGRAVRERINFPANYQATLVRDLTRIPGNPFIDFEVYTDTGQLFYHDMFLMTKNHNVKKI